MENNETNEGLEWILDETSGEFVQHDSSKEAKTNDTPVEETDDTDEDDPNKIKNPYEDVNTTDDDEDGDEEDEFTPEFYEANFSFLKDSGYLMLPDDYEFTPGSKGWEKALEDNSNQIQEIIVEDMFSRLNDEGRALLNFYLKGGTNINEFTQVAAQTDTFDVSTEEGQREAVAEMLRKTTSFSEDKISDYVENSFLNDKLEDEAGEAVQTLKSLKQESLQALEEKAAKDREAYNQRVQEASTELAQVLSTNNNVFGIPIRKTDLSLINNIFEPIRLQDGTVTTKYEYQYNLAMQDPKKVAAIAKILDSDFDFSALTTANKTQATKDLKKKLKDVYTPGKQTRKSKNHRSGNFDWESVDLAK